MTYPKYRLAMFDQAEGGTVTEVVVPFFPYPGLVIRIDEGRWKVRDVEVMPWTEDDFKRGVEEDRPPNVYVTAARTHS